MVSEQKNVTYESRKMLPAATVYRKEKVWKNELLPEIPGRACVCS